jgi:formylglycine-generating enzyme required for sulfatase activity
LAIVFVPNSWIALFVAVIVLTVGGPATAGPDVQAAQAGQIFHDCSNCPNMAVIPAGNFLMGSSTAETQRDIDAMSWDVDSVFKRLLNNEHPQHEVNINRSFAIGRYLVTRGEFAAFVQEIGYAPSKGCIIHRLSPHDSTWPEAGWQAPGYQQTDSDPVVCVSWNDAQAYAAWLNRKLREQTPTADAGSYHLPSEAEWEYAARAGTRTARWWGDDIGRGNADCQGCGSRWDDQQPSPVGSFRPNPFGLFDMLGSAWEWVEDCWHKDYVGAPTDGSAWMAGEWCQQYYTMRGGGFSTSSSLLRPAERSFVHSDERSNGIGFRVARTLP